jgi:S-DNA-T family DNA segregation ATPase FtsK/SpoIIIE
MAQIKTKKSAKAPKKPAVSQAGAEALAVAGIAASVLLVICLFAAGETGFLGVFVNGLLKGLFGLGAYLAPLAIIADSVWVLILRRKTPLRKKLMIIGLFAVITAFAHAAGGDYPPAEGAKEYLITRYNGGAAVNGGLLGALAGDGIAALTGKIGAVIVLSAAALALAILITNRPLFGAVGSAIRNRARYAEYEPEPSAGAEKAGPAPERVSARKTGKKAKMFTIDGASEPEDGKPLTIIGKTAAAPPRGKATPHRPNRAAFRVISLEDTPSPARPPAREPSLGAPAFEGEFVRTDGASFEEDPFFDETASLNAGAGPDPAKPEPPASPPPVMKTDLTPPWDEPDSDIAVRGTGVEGYRPAVVDADGEIVAEAPGKTTERAEPADREYVYPPIELLKENPYVPSLSSKAEILENSRKLEETLKSFGVEAKVVEVCKGPTVTRYEVAPGVGVKVSKISSLADDLALNLAAVGIRIEAPVPGKSVVGIEIPNKETQSVFLREVIGDEAFWAYPSKLSFAIGKDIAGNTVIADIAKMPHLLIAGATGAGKSVCINTLIASIVYKSAPDEVKLLMIDPKVVELSVYNNIPHLLIPVVTDPKKASGALSWAVREMETRYGMFAESFVRDLKGYNAVRLESGEGALPQIVIIIDELADLMMTCGKEVEESICRLAQKARAAGIHLIIATQRPSVDVITGLIKANIPSRLAFAVTSGTDSRTILDMVGAEKLLGKGDMLFSPVGLSKPQRIQGSFISDKEVENLVNFIRQDSPPEFDQEMIDRITTPPDSDDYTPEGSDGLAEDAIAFIVSKEKASVSMLQRKFRIGYNRAARLMEELEDRGVVGPEDGARPRKVLMNQYQYREYKERRENIEY